VAYAVEPIVWRESRPESAHSATHDRLEFSPAYVSTAAATLGTRGQDSVGMTTAAADLHDCFAFLQLTAGRCGGVFTRLEALEAGVPAPVIRTRLRRGEWLAVRRGLYVTAEVYLQATKTAVGAHLLAAAAALRATTETVISHESSALAMGYKVLHHPALPSLTKADRPGRSGDQLIDGTLYTAPLPDHHVTVVAGMASTAPARTVSDVARRRGFRAGVVTADSALRHGLKREELLAVADECAGWPGAPCAKAVAMFADADAESPLESVSRVAMFLRALPRPRLQTWHGEHERLGRSDFDWLKYETIGEADGLEKYEGKPFALRAEKRRQEDLEDTGLFFARWDSKELEDHELKVMRRIWLRLRRGGYSGPPPLEVPRDWRVLLRLQSLDEIWPVE
jgi:hypothetical protein